MSIRQILTFQTRLNTGSAVLDAYATHYGKVERKLFAALHSGANQNDLKREFIRRFAITGRQFNAIRVSLEGKIDAIKERRPDLIAEAETRIKKAAKVIGKLEKQAQGTNKLHQKKRRLQTMMSRLDAQKADHEAKRVRLCFGSKKLFRAQFELAANGYADHAAWKAEWQASRSSQFFVLGSQDETAGNQSCQASINEEGSLTLALRLPDALECGKHLTIPEVRFAYGHDQIVAALQSSRTIDTMTKAGKATRKRVGSAISYRFVRDDKGWRVCATVEASEVVVTTDSHVGAIGVDQNADHLAVAETDRFGNLIGTHRVPLITYGKTPDQAKALIGDAVNKIARQAQASGKPVVIEKLNFQKKKAELEQTDPAQARMISSFAYSRIGAGLKAACYRHGVEVIEINPAYTSVIGAVNHARVRGISVHQGAAYAIARRGLGLSEKPIQRTAIVPVRNGGHVTFVLPVRNRSKHVWSHWSAIRTALKAAHVAHYRSGVSKENSAPLSPAMRALSACRSSVVQSHGANRFQHCSGSVMDDLQF